MDDTQYRLMSKTTIIHTYHCTKRGPAEGKGVCECCPIGIKFLGTNTDTCLVHSAGPYDESRKDEGKCEENDAAQSE